MRSRQAWIGVSAAAALALCLHPGGRLVAELARQATQQAAPDPQGASSSAGGPGPIRGLISDGRYQEAEAAARRLLSAIEAADGLETLAGAEAMDLLVESLWRGGKAIAPDALDFAGRAVRIKERLLGPDHPDTARSINNLARVHGERGEYAQARTWYERALAVREKAFGHDHIEVARSLNNLAIVLKNTGDYAAARRLHERSLAIRMAALGPDHPDVAVTAHNLASLCWRMGDTVKGREFARTAVGIWEKVYGPDDPKLAQSLEGLALFAMDVGNYSGARPLLERALQISERRLGPEHWLVANHLDNLGIIHFKMGDIPGAKELSERALKIDEKALGPDHPETAEPLGTLGDLYLALDNPAAARPLYERALRNREQALGSEHPLVAKSLLGLARALRRQGDPGALPASLRAEAVSRRRFQQVARTLAEREALRYAQARASGLDVAISILADSGAETQRPRDVRAVWDELVRSRAMVLDEMAGRRRSAPGHLDGRLASLAATLEAARSRLARLVMEGPAEADPRTYRDLLREAQEAKESAERALAEKSEPLRVELARQRVGLSDVEAALPEDAALLAYVLFDRYERDGGRAKTGTPTPFYAAFLLRDGGSGPVLVGLGAAHDVEDRVAVWLREAAADPHSTDLNSAAEAQRRYLDAGERLRLAIWDPVVGRLAGARRLFVVPDGALNLVNLGALPSRSEGYLVETDPLVHYVSAERELVSPPHIPQMGRGLLAVGGPDYAAREPVEAARPEAPAADRGAATAPVRRGEVYRGPLANCGGMTSLDFEPLAGARVEAEEIASLWKSRMSRRRSEPLVLLTDAEAGEAAFKRRAAGRRVLHIATHGFFLRARCEAVRASLGSGTGADSPPEVSVLDENPLLLSGLVFAGANRRAAARTESDEEDGLLTAEEIASLDLSGVEWAVLSGCDTGLGKIQEGEGVLGLRRAFRIAGAGTVIMSLWSVDDVAARDWMKRLYRARLSGRPTAEAVRQASRDVLEARRRRGHATHPFFWGAFVAAGDWR